MSGVMLLAAVALVVVSAFVLCTDGSEVLGELFTVVVLALVAVAVASPLVVAVVLPSRLGERGLEADADRAGVSIAYDRLADIGEGSEPPMWVDGPASLWKGTDGSLLVSAGPSVRVIKAGPARRTIKAAQVDGEPLTAPGCTSLECAADAVSFSDPGVADTHVSAGTVMARSEDGTVTEYLPVRSGDGYLLLARADLAGAYQAALGGEHTLTVYGDTGYLDLPAPKDDGDPLERLFEARPAGPAPEWLKWVLLTGGVGVVAGGGVVTWRGARRKEEANEKARSGRW